MCFDDDNQAERKLSFRSRVNGYWRVVAKHSEKLGVIGGNVRNSVSKVTLDLDGSGRLQAVPRRPWFLILENRL